MIMDPLIQTLIDFCNEVFVDNIRAPITEKVRVLLRTCTTEYHGIACNASLNNYVYLKNDPLHWMMMLHKNYFKNHVVGCVMGADKTFSCIVEHWKKFESSLDYVLDHMILNADPNDVQFKRQYDRFRLIGNEIGTLSVDLYIDGVLHDKDVLALMERGSKDRGKMARDEVGAMRFVYNKMKGEYMNEENGKICDMLEKKVPLEKLIFA